MKRTIVLADDHQLLAEGVKTIAAEIADAEIIEVVNDGTELLDFLQKNTPDLVVLDLNMPGQDGLKCLAAIKRFYASVKVLVLTSYNQPELIQKVAEMKADGYIIKSSSAAELKAAIVAVLGGEKYYPVETPAEKETGNSYFMDDFLKKFQLTKREVDIIRMVCNEMSSKQIAADLFLSEFTINTHRKNIFRKLNVKNVAGLMNFAKENGLV